MRVPRALEWLIYPSGRVPELVQDNSYYREREAGRVALVAAGAMDVMEAGHILIAQSLADIPQQEKPQDN